LQKKALIKTIEDALIADSKGIPASVSKTISELENLYAKAVVAIRAYRKKVKIPSAHLREIRSFEETIARHSAHLRVLREGWKRGAGIENAFPAALVWNKHQVQKKKRDFVKCLAVCLEQFGIVVRPSQKLPCFAGQLIVAPNGGVEVSRCRVSCVELEDPKQMPLDVLSGHQATLSSSREAIFDGLKFIKPSRQKLVALMLECDVKTNAGTVILQSPKSYPMLV
jgi:hypothetical protein